MPRKVVLHKKRRYWFHVSTTLTKKEIILHPRGNDQGFNRSTVEPETKRICVSPSLEQCLVAIPYGMRDRLYIYRTKSPVIAHPAQNVFDSIITDEGWLLKPTKFIRMGRINLSKLVDDEGKKIEVISEVAPIGVISRSRKAHRWWRKLNPWKHVLKP